MTATAASRDPSQDPRASVSRRATPGGVETWLSAVPADVREGVRRVLRRRTFSAGEFLVREGEPGDSLWAVESGYVAAQTANRNGVVSTLHVMGRGDVFGELALLGFGGRRTVSIVALERVEAVTLGRREFEILRDRFPTVDRFLVRVLADHVVRLTQLINDAYTHDADTRVLRRLLGLAGHHESGPVRVPIDQSTLAALAGASRQTANRVLRAAEQEGWLALGRRRIEILDLDRLRAAADSPPG
jgi:CRP-like cAMP-binding protein